MTGESLTLTAGFLLGFFSSTHCLGMCGGIMGALTMAVDSRRATARALLVVCYNLGRIASYTLMGAIAGALGYSLTALGAGPVLRTLAGLLLIVMALYLADWWRGLTRLEQLGRGLWARLSPLTRRFMPVRRPHQALALGALWGWLPCGLVYSALSYAMTQPSALAGAGLMAAFGLGTLPAVLLAAAAAGRVTALARSRWLRRGGALLLLVFGLWTLYGGLAGFGGGHSAHASHAHKSHS